MEHWLKTSPAEANDITIVDNDALRLRASRIDWTFARCKAVPHTLMFSGMAGAEDADMLIAVTNNDEVNIVVRQDCLQAILKRQPKLVGSRPQITLIRKVCLPTMLSSGRRDQPRDRL